MFRKRKTPRLDIQGTALRVKFLREHVFGFVYPADFCDRIAQAVPAHATTEHAMNVMEAICEAIEAGQNPRFAFGSPIDGPVVRCQ